MTYIKLLALQGGDVRFILSILLSFLLLSCSEKSEVILSADAFDSERMGAISIRDKEFRKSFKNELSKNDVKFIEGNILGGDSYIIYKKSESKHAEEAYTKVVGTKPGAYSVSLLSELANSQLEKTLNDSGIPYVLHRWHEDTYITWEPEYDAEVTDILNIEYGNFTKAWSR